MNSYFIQAGRDGVHWDYFRKKSIVAVDYKEICDFDLAGMTREEIKEGIKENRKQYEKKQGKPSNPIDELNNIAQIKAGDLIAVTVGRSSVKEFAIATSDYYFTPDKNANEENAHRVDVEYLDFGTDKIYSDSPKGILRDASNKILSYLGKQEESESCDYWAIKAGKQTPLWSTMLSSKTISFAGHDIDFSKFYDEVGNYKHKIPKKKKVPDELRDEIDKKLLNFDDFPKDSKSRETKISWDEIMIHPFMEIKKNDIVVVWSENKIHGYGKVVDGYEYKLVNEKVIQVDADGMQMHHQKRVEWIDTSERQIPQEYGISWSAQPIQELPDKLKELLFGKKQQKYFIITQNPDSGYDDVEGEQYQYDNHKPNFRSFVEGSNFIVQSKINEVNHFVGYGKVGTIETSEGTTEKGVSITKFTAKYSDYAPFEEPKIRTDEIHQKMKDQKSYGGRAPSILPIDQSLYAEIIGEDLIENVQTHDTLPPSDLKKYSKILEDDLNLLFYGPPGTGKTYLANNLAEEFTFKQIQDFEKVIPEVRYQPDFVDSMSDDEYKEFVINSIKKESEKRKFTFTEINTYGQYSIEKNGQQFHLDFHYSASTTQDPDDSYVEISQANIDFLNQVPIENRFIVIVNHSHKNFVVLPYSIEQNHAKFSDSSAGNWDPSGKNAHSFHVEIKKDECKFKGKNYDCKKFLRNVGIIFGQFIRKVTFHPSYSYEEFVEGIRPNLDSDQISYKLEHGIFKEICRQAEFDPKNRYVLLIDEINRGNIPKIFGELITLIEDEKREEYSLNLTYSKELFTVPKNLYIIGAMNTADQSISQLDIALRRRFSHKELMPDPTKIDEKIKHKLTKDVDGNPAGTSMEISLKSILVNINKKIMKTAGREKQIGHSYFMKKGKAISDANGGISLLRDRLGNKIIPLIQEYFYEDMTSVHVILGDGFIDKNEEVVVKDNLDDLDKFAVACKKLENN